MYYLWLCSCLQCRRPRFNPWVGKIPWRRKWHPTPVLLPGKSHRLRSLVGYSPWCRKELDTTERLQDRDVHATEAQFSSRNKGHMVCKPLNIEFLTLKKFANPSLHQLYLIDLSVGMKPSNCIVQLGSS